MEHPEIFYPSEKYQEKQNTLQPVYGLTTGLSNNAVAKAIRQALNGLDLTKEHLPEALRQRYGFSGIQLCYSRIDFPEDQDL